MGHPQLIERIVEREIAIRSIWSAVASPGTPPDRLQGDVYHPVAGLLVRMRVARIPGAKGLVGLEPRVEGPGVDRPGKRRPEK